MDLNKILKCAISLFLRKQASLIFFVVVGEELAVLNFYFHRFLAGDVAFETLEGSLPSVPDFLTLLLTLFVSFAEGAFSVTFLSGSFFSSLSSSTGKVAGRNSSIGW